MIMIRPACSLKRESTSSVNQFQVFSRVTSDLRFSTALDRIVDHRKVERLTSDRSKHGRVAEVAFMTNKLEHLVITQRTLGDRHHMLVVQTRLRKNLAIQLAIERTLQVQVRTHTEAIGERRVDHSQLRVFTNRPGDEVNHTERLAVLRRGHQQHHRLLAGLKSFQNVLSLIATERGNHSCRELQARVHHTAVIPKVFACEI